MAEYKAIWLKMGIRHGTLLSARRAKAFSGGLHHNTCLQYPGYALLVKLEFDVFCSCIMLENKVTTTTTFGRNCTAL